MRHQRTHWKHRLSLVAAAVSFTFLTAPATSAHARHAMKPAPRVVITGSVIAGNPSSFSALATVDRRAVFAEIPAYQRIVRERLTKRDARYHFLLREANRSFHRALAAVAADMKVDLVVAQGGVEATGLMVLDLTPALKKQVRPDPASSRKE